MMSGRSGAASVVVAVEVAGRVAAVIAGPAAPEQAAIARRVIGPRVEAEAGRATNWQTTP